MTRQLRPSIPLDPNGTTRLGSDPSLGPQHRLVHPLVALRHVEVTLGAGKARLRDLGFGTFVNSDRVTGREVDLEQGDQIDVGPFAYLFTGVVLETISSLSTVQLTARNLCRTVPYRRGERFILNDVSLVIEPGQFVCLLGPSGCGKSTLLAALSGRSQPTSGQVLVNNRDLYEHFNVLKRHIAFVPQKPVIHAELKLREALWYTARLRLPSSIDRAGQVKQLVEKMQLEEHENQLTRQLSGGQEKRACLANELLSDPGLVFLDEVTSGLDENIDGELMRFFQELAHERGKTVVCVTHCLAHVEETCDLVVFLTPGGQLAYVGEPKLAPQYFNVTALGDIYGLLTPERADDWANKFRASSEYAMSVTSRLPESALPATPASPRAARVPLLREALTIVYQTALLTLRQRLLFRRDRASLRGLLGQVFFVALILIFAFGKIGPFPPESKPENTDRTRKERLDEKERTKSLSLIERKEWEEAHRVETSYVPRSSLKRVDYVRKVLNLMFLLAVVSFWFGCNNAAKEIVRERTITTQERFFNLHAGAYYLSKLLVLTAIGWVQVLLLLFAVWYFCEPPLNVRKPAEAAAAKTSDAKVQAPAEKKPMAAATELIPLLLALSFAGTTLGLFLSAISPSESVAVTLIPIAVIPQIVLSGAIVKLGPLADYFSQLTITTYWGKVGMDSLLVGEAGDFARKAETKLIESTGTFYPILFILIHAGVFIILALAALSAHGSLRGSMGKLRTWGERLVGVVGRGWRSV